MINFIKWYCKFRIPGLIIVVLSLLMLGLSLKISLYLSCLLFLVIVFPLMLWAGINYRLDVLSERNKIIAKLKDPDFGKETQNQQSPPITPAQHWPRGRGNIKIK